MHSADIVLDAAHPHKHTAIQYLHQSGSHFASIAHAGPLAIIFAICLLGVAWIALTSIASAVFHRGR